MHTDRKTKRALARAKKYSKGGSVGPAPKSNKLVGEFRDPSERAGGIPWLIQYGKHPLNVSRELGARRVRDPNEEYPDRGRARVALADGGTVDDPTADMSPIDLLRLRTELDAQRDPADHTRSATGLNTIHEVLGMLPVTGNVMAAGDAYTGARDALKAARAGRWRDAAVDAGLAGVSAAGALSPLPWSARAGRAAREGRDTVNIFAGLSAKIADKVAHARALEMQNAGVDRADIWRETGWFQGPEGKWRFEIPDNDARSTGVIGPTLDKSLNHPELYSAYPDMRGIEVEPGRGLGKAAFSRGNEPSGIPDSIRVSPSGVGVDTMLHEGQHGVQVREGLTPGGSPMNAFPADGQSGAWSIYRERIRKMTTPLSAKQYARAAGFNGNLKESAASYAQYVAQTKKAAKQGVEPYLDRIAQESSADEWYKRLAGEVEARNVQKRYLMTAEERRASPPWMTQDIPDEQQIIRPALRQGEQQNVLIPSAEGPATNLAREMRVAGQPNERIWRDIKRVVAPDGSVRQEIPDMGMSLKGNPKPGDITPASHFIRHPRLFANRPELAEKPVFVTSERDHGGMSVVRTLEGNRGYQVNPETPDIRSAMAKLFQYDINAAEGLAAPLRHGTVAIERGLDSARGRADLLDPKNRDAVDAYLDRLAEVRDNYNMRRELETYIGQGGRSDAAATVGRQNAGNVDARVAALRARLDPGEAQSMFPYRRVQGSNAVTDRLPKFDDTFVLPPENLHGQELLDFIERWGQFGSGRGKFARGGRVKNALKRARAVTGAVRGKTGGREDALPVSVPSGAYVIPADVVAALGGGNSESGHARLEKMYGKPRRAAGGRVGAVPILISHGEYVLSPEAVERAGGHDALDAKVTSLRNAWTRHLQELEGPNK